MQTLDQIKCQQCGSPHLTYGDNTSVGANSPGATIRNGTLILCQSCGTQFKYNQAESAAIAPVAASPITTVHNQLNSGELGPNSRLQMPPRGVSNDKFIWDENLGRHRVNPEFGKIGPATKVLFYILLIGVGLFVLVCILAIFHP
jgi:hypothetical protein